MKGCRFCPTGGHRQLIGCSKLHRQEIGRRCVDNRQQWCSGLILASSGFFYKFYYRKI
jgi:hypothetical protein